MTDERVERLTREGRNLQIGALVFVIAGTSLHPETRGDAYIAFAILYGAGTIVRALARLRDEGEPDHG